MCFGLLTTSVVGFATRWRRTKVVLSDREMDHGKSSRRKPQILDELGRLRCLSRLMSIPDSADLCGIAAAPAFFRFVLGN